MSYSFSSGIEPIKADEVADLVLEHQTDEGNAQVAAAAGHMLAIKEALAILVPAILRDGDTVRVTVSGHANADNEPNPGWASNGITISITQVYPD